jgi:hypothetical protein
MVNLCKYIKIYIFLESKLEYVIYVKRHTQSLRPNR